MRPKFLTGRGRLSISAKVALSFIVVVIFQGTLTQLGMSVLISESNSINFEKQMVQRVTASEVFISQTLSDLYNKVDLLSGQQNIVTYSQFRLINLLNRELALFNAPLNLEGIAVFGEDGQIIASDSSLANPNPQLRSLVRDAYRRGQQSFLTETDEGIHLWFISQIVSSERVIGVLGARIAIDNRFLDRVEEITGARVALRYRDGFIRSTDFPESELSNLRSIPPDQARDAFINLGSYLYGTLPLDQFGFQQTALVTLLDMDESRRLIRQYNLLSVFFTLIVLLVASGFSIFFYRQIFLKPYQMLQNGVSRIGDGDFSYPIHHKSGDEFGELVDSVERMRISLLNRDRELKALATYNELILNNVRSGILTITDDGLVNSWNAEARKMVHVPSDPVPSLPLPLSRAGLPGEVYRVIIDGLERGNYSTLKECRSSFKGKDEIFSVSTSPFYGGSGEKLGIIAVIADVTQVKKLEEQLHISQRLAAIGEMVAGVAHQLRNPMAIMKVSAEMLRDNFHMGEQYGQLTSALVSEIDSLNYIIDNFLNFSRPIHTNLGYYDLEKLVRGCLGLLPMSQFPNADIRIDSEPGLPPAKVDKSLMEQVFSNLILNALEVSQESDPPQLIRVELRGKPGRIEASVRDWGTGMDEDVMKNIFNPFYTNKPVGIGLGLSIVHRIVQEHGGRIEVKSQVGKESTFTVILNRE